MSSIMDSAADIKIYNYKTKTVHTKKGVVIYDTATNIFKCFGNECVKTFDKFRYDKNIIQVVPICMGKYTTLLLPSTLSNGRLAST